MKKIIFCGGGSAGHVMPNVAIIEKLGKDFEIAYIGTDAIEKSICTSREIKFYEFDGVKLVRGKVLCNLTIPFKLIKSYRQCKKILKAQQPDLLFCKGGYASLPPAIAAARLKIPVLTHESDLSAGLANKIIARTSKKILTSFPETARKFSKGVYTGSPMRESLFGRDKLEAKRKLGLDLRPTVLVFGGGSGSHAINVGLRECVLDLCKKYNVVHLCGKGNATATNIDGYKQIEFCDDMGLIYAACDYAVARCGSNSAFELLALKIPTLFIPLENGSSRGDQVDNANYFKERSLCRVLKERDLTARTLKNAIDELIADEKLKAALTQSNVECGNKRIEIEIRAVINR